ncbi:WhiB family redox-sensing transcriptional regulator [Saccharopolyspora lacisalsi]|uniref:WhiB family redox-sensing transcriptional regulator n=1 Tax=Halosaccharopolyspora lacisalsi TaxID=1000566 RepID=A0A839E1N3_9PSEU|nr:WhiB family transcriptional regulator [Halosaccharopolyspora lacisalsi]MBA8825311.1 WhiB family redox-sensing transcriptional regulator [Halosaccharopolyspora lacisalsi]
MTSQQRLTRTSALYRLLTHLDGFNFGGHPVCAESDPELFFPVSSTTSQEVARAKEICAGCEIREACLNFALHNGDQGIWGGTTTQERREMRATGASGTERAA